MPSGEVKGPVLVGDFGCRPNPDPRFKRKALKKPGRIPTCSGRWHLHQRLLRRLAERGRKSGSSVEGCFVDGSHWKLVEEGLKPVWLGGWFFLWQSLRWLAWGKSEFGPRWWKVFSLAVASAAAEGGTGSRHQSGAGCFANSRFGGLRRRNPISASSGLRFCLAPVSRELEE